MGVAIQRLRRPERIVQSFHPVNSSSPEQALHSTQGDLVLVSTTQSIDNPDQLNHTPALARRMVRMMPAP
jgi:hypothetical protein